MIEARHLTKRYGNILAVDDLSFDVKPGMVTGFLGPNGAGKTTTMRLILGLDRPSNGEVTIGGRRYPDLPAPLHEVGALLDAKAVHDGRSAYNHLLCLAQSNGIPRKRVERCWGSWAWRAWPAAGLGATRWGWANGSVSRRPCWVIPGS